MHTDLSNADYHAHPAYSKSDLDAANKSGRHLFDKKNGPPRPSTAAFDLGTALHAAALPGESLDSVAVRMPEGLKKTTKEGKAFVAEHGDKIIRLLFRGRLDRPDRLRARYERSIFRRPSSRG